MASLCEENLFGPIAWATENRLAWAHQAFADATLQPLQVQSPLQPEREQFE